MKSAKIILFSALPLVTTSMWLTATPAYATTDPNMNCQQFCTMSRSERSAHNQRRCCNSERNLVKCSERSCSMMEGKRICFFQPGAGQTRSHGSIRCPCGTDYPGVSWGTNQFNTCYPNAR